MNHNFFTNIKSVIITIKNKADKYSNIISGILLGFIAFLLIPTPVSQVAPGLDNSWITSLHLLAESTYKFGLDVTFTYGPLGFLIVPQNINSLFILSILFWIITFVILILVLGYIIFKILPSNRRVWGTALLTIILLVFGICGLENYFTITAFVLLLATWFTDNKCRLREVFFILACLYMGIMFFAKLNAGIEIFCAILIFLVAAFVQKDRIRISALCLTIITTIISLFALYLYTGSIGGFFNYITNCIEIVSGYNIGMSFTPDTNSLVIFVGIFALLIAIIIFVLLFVLWIKTYKIDKKAFWFLLIVILYTFFEFKHGFIRAGPGHTVLAFKNMALIFGITALVLPWGSYSQKIKQKVQLKVNKNILKRISFVLCIILVIAIVSVSIFCIVSPLPYKAVNYTITKISDYHSSIIFPNKIEQISNQINVISNPINIVDTDILPTEFISEIGTSSVTVMPWEINYVVYNNLTSQYVPLPSLQTYQAYSYYLEKQYEEFFNSSSSPEYIIVDFDALDYGNLILETPGAWNIIVQKYNLVLSSGNTSLLKKRISNADIQSDRNVIFEQTSANSEVIDFPNTYDYGKFVVSMNLTPFGKLMKLIYKISPVYMRFTFDDDSEITYRVVPELLETGVSVYLPTSIEELNSLMKEGKLNKKISKIQFINGNRGILEYYLNGICYYGDMHVVYTAEKTNNVTVIT